MDSIDKVEFFSERLKLKLLKPQFADRVLEFYIRNKSHLEIWEPSRPEGFYTFGYQYKLLDDQIENFKLGTTLSLWIFKEEDYECENVLGAVNFSNIIFGAFKSCFVGYKMDYEHINKGYMTEAIIKGISIMFDGYKLHRIEANIIPRNIQSNRVIEKIGFEKEGLSPKYLQINGVWEDHYRYAILNSKVE